MIQLKQIILFLLNKTLAYKNKNYNRNKKIKGRSFHKKWDYFQQKKHNNNKSYLLQIKTSHDDLLSTNHHEIRYSYGLAVVIGGWYIAVLK